MALFPIEIYQDRRAKVLKKMPNESALMIPSSALVFRSQDVHYPYRPHSDMIYLSGWEETNSILMLIRNPDQTEKQILFVQDKDPKQELWTGPVHGPEAAGEITRMDSCYTSNQFLTVAKELLKNIQHLYYSFGCNPLWDKQVKHLLWKIKDQRNISPSVHDSVQLIAPLRMQKNQQELELMKKVAHISALAHKEVMQLCRPGKTEKQLENIFLAAIRKNGANEVAYPGIFAAGESACILHYTHNNQTLNDGELLLVDAGAEYHYYASDISRTFPINGQFSKTQKQFYKRLLQIQKALIKELKPGISFQDVQNRAATLISEWMIEEKLLSGTLKKVLQSKEYKKYFPHNFGHSIGLDVHDVVFSSKPLILEENFVVTMEPGIYFPVNDFSLPETLRGIGIRIEDEVLIQADGAKVLSYEAPKEVEELEALIGCSK